MPSWSPDGSHIVFLSDRAGTSELWTMNADGSGQTQITNDGTAKDERPAYSPDGARLAYSAGGDVVVANADGSDPHAITTDPGSDIGPAWSPDSTQIAFVSDRSGTPAVYVIGVDGTGEHVVLEGQRYFIPAWGRDTR